MTQPMTPSIVSGPPQRPPTQMAFDNILETLVALTDAAVAISGDQTFGHSVLHLSDMPHDVWHAFPQPVLSGQHVSSGHVWKHIARLGDCRIAAFCVDGAACPDFPRTVSQSEGTAA